MPKLIDSNTESIVRTLSEENYSSRAIKNKLEEKDIDISIKSICNILNNIGIKRKALNANEPVPKNRSTPIKRNLNNIRKVKQLTQKENPASYRAIQNKTGLSLQTISKIIHVDLKKETKKKSKVHRLTDKNRKNRKANCRKLYENHLAGDRSEFVVTLDEALVYLEDTNKSTRICYVDRGENVPDNWVFEKDESFKEGFMVIGVMSGRGVLPLIRVPSEVKINSERYIDLVLKPLFTKHLPSLYPHDMNKVYFHHDKCTSHTAGRTTAYLEQLRGELGISYIVPKDIPVKAPDASPLDFFGFGYLKQELSKRRARTLDGVWKLANSIWSDISQDTVDSVFAAWKRRCRLIARRDGAHIEHIKNIHRRRIK
jgi:hypothetical protein